MQLSATISLFAGTNSNSGLAYSELDLRQTFLTVGKAKLGTFTVGRNFGLFGFDAIINDMSLIGVGATAAPKNPLNTTLGGIGYGYIYCDRLTQINYSTPKTGGFQLTLGIFNPLNMASLGIPSDVGETNSTRPGIHGKATYGMAKDNFKLDLSASFISQNVETAVSKFNPSGFDFYAKLGAGAFGLGAYYYSGKGLGTTVLLFDAADPKGLARSSSGYYLQPTVTFGATKIGINYGVSSLDKTANDAPTTLKQHTRMTVGLYQTVTEGLTFIAEYTSNKAKSHADGQIKNGSIAVGLFMGFLIFIYHSSFRIMILTGQHTVNASAQAVWNILMNPDALARIVPGITKLERIDDDNFKAVAEVKIGPVGGAFTGNLKVSDKIEPQSFKLIVQQNSKIGNASAIVNMNLTALSAGQTQVNFNGDVKLSGTLAIMGGRVITPVANMLTKQFFEELDKELA